MGVGGGGGGGGGSWRESGRERGGVAILGMWGVGVVEEEGDEQITEAPWWLEVLWVFCGAMCWSFSRVGWLNSWGKGRPDLTCGLETFLTRCTVDGQQEMVKLLMACRGSSWIGQSRSSIVVVVCIQHQHNCRAHTVFFIASYV